MATTEDEPRAWAERRIGPLSLWEADTSSPLVEASVGTVLAKWAEATPDVRALTWPDGGELRHLTYRELYDKAVDRAHLLAAVTKPGERIASWAPNSVDLVLLEYASALAGTVFTPLNPAFLDSEMQHSVLNAEAAVLFAVKRSRDKPLLDRARALAPALETVRHIVDLETWDGLDARAPELPDVKPSDPFLMQYTSGTTGRPKAAVLSHRACYNGARFMAHAVAFGGHQVWMLGLPIHHVAGSVSRLLGALSVGGTIVLAPELDVETLFDLMEATGTTHGGFVAKQAIDLLDDPVLRQRTLPELRTVGMGGSASPTDLIHRVEAQLHVKVVNAYGQSESSHITMTRPGDSDEDRTTTVGHPFPQRDVCIMNPDGSGIVPIGELGEICTRGPLVMDGYLGRYDSLSAIDADGWLHTGDLGSMDNRGYVTHLGRQREVIIRGGENIYPVEVEQALIQHPAVAEVAVVARPDRRWGEEVAAFIRPVTPGGVDDEELRTYARTRLASFKVPRYWRFVDEFPRTAGGKILKSDLAATLAKESAETGEST